MKIKDFINMLAVRCGRPDDKALIDLLSRQDLECIEIGDDLAGKLLKRLFTFQEAKNHTKLKNHFIGESLKIVDFEVNKAADRIFPDCVFTKKVKNTRNTYEKLRMFIKKTEGVLPGSG